MNLAKRVFPSVLVVGCAIAAASPSLAATPEAPSASVLDALPGSPQGEVYLEAIAAIDDLRVVLDWQTKTLEPYFGRTPFTRAQLDPAVQKENLGFDFVTEAKRWVALAAPRGGPVPVALAVFSREGQLGVQLMVKVAPGFAERLGAEGDTPLGAPWRGRVDGERLLFSYGEQVWEGRVDQAGWLRVAPSAEMLLGSAGRPTRLFSEDVQRWLGKSPLVAAVFGGGTIAEMMGAAVSDVSTQELLRGVRSFTMSAELSEGATWSMRMLVDSPHIEQFGALLRAPDLANTPVKLWDAEASSLLSFAVPQSLLMSVLGFGQMMLGDSPFAIPDDLGMALSKLAGRVSFAGFGSPGDWGVGLELTDPRAAAAMVPALQSYLSGLSSRAGVEPAGLILMQPFPALGAEALLVRPDELLEGVRVASVGSTVVAVRQKSRLPKLIAQRDASAAQASGEAGFLAQPLTPKMRELLRRPAIVQGYFVSGSDGSLVDWLVWPSKAIESIAKVQHLALNTAPGSELLGAPSSLQRLPLRMALAAHAMALIYDFAFSADVDGSVLVFELASSQI